MLAVLLLILASAGIYGAFSIFWTIPPAYLGGTAAGGGIALICCLGGFGGFASPNSAGWARGITGSQRDGLLAIGVILLAGALAVLLGIPSCLLHERRSAALER